MTDKEFDQRMAAVQAFIGKRKALERTRGWRNKVDPLSLDYEDYRKTRLWKGIKTCILARDGNSCKRCGGAAEIVHHITYHRDVMLGRDDSKLVALCSGCHEIVHFDKHGTGRLPEQQVIVLKDLSFNEVQPKVDMRRDPFRLPSWKRLTAVQRRTYLDEYNAKKMQRAAGNRGEP